MKLSDEFLARKHGLQQGYRVTSKNPTRTRGFNGNKGIEDTSKISDRRREIVIWGIREGYLGTSKDLDGDDQDPRGHRGAFKDPLPRTQPNKGIKTP